MPDDQAVLYVDDDALIRELVASALEEAGFEVVVAENGAAAITTLDEDADSFCAVVTDIDLGVGPNGWEVARRARELNNALSVIYVTGGSGSDWQSNGVKNSIMLVKPFSMKQLVNTVSSLLKKFRPKRRAF
jgi:DNA-binding response OmpR family regulator